MYSVALPLNSDFENLETIQELQAITCLGRAFVGVRGSDMSAHFELQDDVTCFLETFVILIDGMSGTDFSDGEEAGTEMVAPDQPDLNNSLEERFK